MKKIEAIIKPFKLEEVRDALTDLGISDLTISEVKGCGRRSGLFETLRGRGSPHDYCTNIRLEVVVPEALSGSVCTAIAEKAKTGSVNDGNIFITQVDEAIRINIHKTEPKLQTVQMAAC
ncbi:MAG: P-II family nitrogen regulator [Limisphaerales bacterium]